jgi:hypothetical protein
MARVSGAHRPEGLVFDHVTVVSMARPEAETDQRVVDRQSSAGYDFIKVHNILRPEVFDAICAEARSRGIDVVGHPRRRGLEHAYVLQLAWQRAR